MEFVPWPKISRFDSPYTITEKIDGTNACIIVEQDEHYGLHVGAQSRRRIITPDDDNYGFARWVYENHALLGSTLGPGYHFGEWYGAGIQRRYGLDRKYFALFNTDRWSGFNDSGAPLYDIGVRHVPVLLQGENFSHQSLAQALYLLQDQGSGVNPDFKNAEGVVVHFKHNRTNFKYILDK